MPLKNTRKADHSRTRMARTEKELKAEQGARRRPKKVALSVKVAQAPASKPSPVIDPAGTGPAGFAPALPAAPAEKDIALLVERQKRFIILSGVTFFMVVIAVLWVFGVSASLRASRAELSSRGEDGALDDLTGELSRELEKIRGELDDSESAVPDRDFAQSPAVLGGLPISSTTMMAGGASTALGAGTTTVIAPDIVERLKEKLE